MARRCSSSESDSACEGGASRGIGAALWNCCEPDKAAGESRCMSELPGAAAAGTPLVVWFDEAGAAGATATAAGVVAGCCGLAGERPIGVTSAAGLASLVLLVGVVGANENNEPLPAGLDDSGEVQIELAGVPWSDRANERSDIRATRERERCVSGGVRVQHSGRPRSRSRRREVTPILQRGSE